MTTWVAGSIMLPAAWVVIFLFALVDILLDEPIRTCPAALIGSWALYSFIIYLHLRLIS